MGPNLGFLSFAPRGMEHELELMSASRHDVEILVGMMANSLSRSYGTRPRSSCSFL
jgi:hypothetical protein